MQTSRKGLSTFIATLLLMVLAVSAAVTIYAYTMHYIGFSIDAQIPTDSMTTVTGYVIGYSFSYDTKFEVAFPDRCHLIITISKTANSTQGFAAILVPNEINYTPHIGDYVYAVIKNMGRDNITTELIIHYRE